MNLIFSFGFVSVFECLSIADCSEFTVLDSDLSALTISVSFFNFAVMFFSMLRFYGYATDLAKLRSLYKFLSEAITLSSTV